LRKTLDTTRHRADAEEANGDLVVADTTIGGKSSGFRVLLLECGEMAKGLDGDILPVFDRNDSDFPGGTRVIGVM
jgi:hypothetical protein